MDLTHGVLVRVMMCHDVITRAVLNVRDVEKLLHSEGPASAISLLICSCLTFQNKCMFVQLKHRFEACVRPLVTSLL